MYYLTNHNFSKLLGALYLDLPMNYAEAYDKRIKNMITIIQHTAWRVLISIFISLQKMKREH